MARGGWTLETESEEEARKPLSARRQAWILAAGKALFLKYGYAGTNVDAIATAAGLSKGTVYKHFASKEDLFYEVIQALTHDIMAPLAEVDTGRGLSDTLHRFGERLLAQALMPDALALARICIAETTRFPELTAMADRAGRGSVVASLAAFLERRMESGELKACNATRAAEQFQGLILGTRHFAALLASQPPLSPAERSELTTEAVRGFLAIYATEKTSA